MLRPLLHHQLPFAVMQSVMAVRLVLLAPVIVGHALLFVGRMVVRLVLVRHVVRVLLIVGRVLRPVAVVAGQLLIVTLVKVAK